MTGNPDNASSVFVAGGSGVIGQAICHQFGKHHWHVGVHYHTNQESAERTSRIIRNFGGVAIPLKANVQDHAHTDIMVRQFIENKRRLDVLIWAIGISETHLLMRTTAESWFRLMNTNLTGCFHLLKTAAPFFEKQGHGSVVIIGSLSALQGTTGQVAYATSKAGLLGLMKSVAQEWAPWNIRVNAIFPGWHASPLSGSAFPHDIELDNHVLESTLTTEHVAKAVYHLALMEGISGQV